MTCFNFVLKYHVLKEGYTIGNYDHKTYLMKSTGKLLIVHVCIHCKTVAMTPFEVMHFRESVFFHQRHLDLSRASESTHSMQQGCFFFLSLFSWSTDHLCVCLDAVVH